MRSILKPVSKSFACLVAGACLLSTAPLLAQTNEYRAFWVDSWGAGINSATEINTLTNDLRKGKFNTVIPQVRRRGDAFYNSNFEPKNASVSPGSFDPLADLVAKCSNTNFGPKIEVHAWIVSYHIWQGSNAPSNPAHPFNLHPDWLLRDVNSNTLVGNEYTFDPGHPEVQRHTFNVAMDIITNYNVDGLNFDYIRYSDINQGYNAVAVARFNQRYGRTGQPAPSDTDWKQFRRDQVTALVRKVYLNAIAVKPGIKISADTITWSPGPTSVASWYSSSAAWNSVLQDWRGWMEEGILDLTIPMAYFDQAGAYKLAWTNWNNFAKDNQYSRHAIIGPGIYLNSVSNAIVQMRYTRTNSPGGNPARGSCGYSYRVTNKDGVSRATFLDALVNPSAYDPITPPIFSQPATIPVMPWKTAPTLGHLKGTIYTGNITNGLDGAVVTLTGPVTRVQTNDATGFYGFVDLPAGSYSVRATFPGYGAASNSISVVIGSVATRDVALALSGPPEIVAPPASRTNYTGTPASFTVSASGLATLAYQWRKDGTNLTDATNTTHAISSVTTNDAGGYSVVVTNSLGAVTSAVGTLTVLVPPSTSRTVPLWNLAPGSRTYLSATDSTQRGLSFNPANSRLLLVSRTVGTNVFVLNSTNGADLHTLTNGSGVITGGTFPVNLIGVADDGAVYVGNLTTDGSTTAFRLYRWANDNPTTVPTVAFSGNPYAGSAERWGDTLDVRGAGTNTQILLGTRSGTNASILTTANGTSYTANSVAVSGGDTGMFGLGLAFGAGNTFWGKASSKPLRQISFNLGTASGTVIQSFTNPIVPNAVAPIGISTNLGLLGGVAIETPDNFQLFDLPTSGAPTIIETNQYPTDNANANATGSVDFGGDRVFALDSNNGILALMILPPPIAPTVSTNPQSTTVVAGDNVALTVAANGTAPLSYQWRLEGVALPGATGDTLNLLNAQPTDAGNYTVVITNIAGAVTSAVAVLTVNVPPDITGDPQPLTVVAGSNATFNVTATGTAPLGYQWRFNNADIPGATAISYTRSNTITAHAGNYSVAVSNAAGIAVSADALLTVQYAPIFTLQPVAQIVRVGSNVTFAAAADALPAANYLWHFNGAPISGATNSSLPRLNVQTNDAGLYSVTASNAVGGLVSSNATLVVNPWAAVQFQSITRLPDGRMQMIITGEPQAGLWIDSANVLPVWSDLTNIFNTNGTVDFTDNTATNNSRRFYRARQ